MLSPTIYDAQELLTDSFNNVMQLDSYAFTSNNTIIGKLPDDPDWLTSVRSRMSMLSTAGNQWVQDRPDIWGSILLQFPDYATAFAGVHATAQENKLSQDQWLELLKNVLRPQLTKAVKDTGTAVDSLKTHQQAFANIQPLLDKSINEGWNALSQEEQQMQNIAAKLQHLQDLVASLQSSITSEDISTGKEIATTTVTLLYKVATETAEESISFMDMASIAITIGKYFYEEIEDTAEVASTLKEIADLQIQASDAAQAAAGTKLVLQLLNNLELTFSQIGKGASNLQTLWSEQLDSVNETINALEANADPSQLFDLVTLSTANANWQALSAFATSIPQKVTQAGSPVILDPQNPNKYSG
ncbi:hypothetical protein R9X49_00335 [Pectobacterium carotovorum]|uniref:alpha-pore-forming cytotoxin subunit MakB n=1 Tax=Pectobacterium carotovorum TaxID=554 RepID=UPI0029D85D90|nr:hypothetical protein [Pectobacterium carotovorum]MDX6913560.1 hypothetical protein [Pectobacterium carotovorum]